MSQLIAAAIFAAAASAFGNEAAIRPVGTWVGKATDGSVNTLTVEEKSISWKSEIPEKGTVTLSVPSYEISEDGVLFGYAKEISFVGKENIVHQWNLKNKEITPFAIRLRFDDKSLTVSDLKMFRADEKGQRGFSGTYQKLETP